ncbi:cytochrome P450 [Actinospongicola halichondriae]|uniref:cytochrome P450 n=1 Tax=Actinospongicola halichondriae TaxID=3236844 RepID=UPI003D3BD41B
MHEPSDLAAPLADGAFYAGDPYRTYASLRREEPVAWCDPGGFWALSTHAGVLAASTDPDTFCSRRGILAMEIGVEYATPPTMMHTDPPEHTAYRKLVAPGFRPSVIRRTAERVADRTEEVLDRLPEGAFDAVESLAVPLPLLLIADVLGVPTDDLDRFFAWSEAAIPGESNMDPGEQQRLIGECWAYLLERCNDRRADPADDLVSVLVHTELDGRRLSDDELVMFLNQLLIAGNETTRNAISGGLHAFADHPDQWQQLVDDPTLVDSAVEEILRWTTPVISFLRTTTREVDLEGQTIPAGDPVLLLYQSANRDENEFGATASTFLVDRRPNHHLSFGFGAHFCIGASLARMEIATLLRSLLRRGWTPSGRGEVVRTASPVIAGLRSLPLAFDGR